MGRYSTGVNTTKQTRRIELSYLLKKGFIQKGRCISGTLSWTDDSNIGIYTCYKESQAYIELDYTTTYHATNEKKSFKYRIDLESIPSNLGKGEVLYMVCPVSAKRCRILYKCYGSQIWKSRYAYRYRIYYQSQISSKLHHYIDRYWDIEKHLEELYSRVVKSHYRGRKTALQRRIERLEYKQEYYDEMRWRIVPKAIQNILNVAGLQSAEELF